MPTPTHLAARIERLRWLCVLIWFGTTLLPVILSAYPHWRLWGWPLDFWMAAQGSVLVYLALVAYYAWQVNRWERQSGESAIDIPGPQA